ncbi:MAG: hypothetical protein GY859_04540, partial [Desulfobacterales bacterium]|nr:hypothetical protein [Desulfobacterales bacterium]
MTDLAPVNELKSALSEDFRYYGDIQLVRIMGEIGDVRFIPDFLRILREADSRSYIYSDALAGLHAIDEAGHEAIFSAIQNGELKDPSTILAVLWRLPYTESFDIATGFCENGDAWEEIESYEFWGYYLSGIGDPRGIEILRMFINKYNARFCHKSLAALCGLHNRSVPELSALPVEKKPKISKNRPCPCGSGRKYKK